MIDLSFAHGTMHSLHFSVNKTVLCLEFLCKSPDSVQQCWGQLFASVCCSARPVYPVQGSRFSCFNQTLFSDLLESLKDSSAALSCRHLFLFSWSIGVTGLNSWLRGLKCQDVTSSNGIPKTSCHFFSIHSHMTGPWSVQPFLSGPRGFPGVFGHPWSLVLLFAGTLGS